MAVGGVKSICAMETEVGIDPRQPIAICCTWKVKVVSNLIRRETIPAVLEAEIQCEVKHTHLRASEQAHMTSAELSLLDNS